MFLKIKRSSVELKDDRLMIPHQEYDEYDTTAGGVRGGGGARVVVESN
jgi:hypothetical protein